MKKKGASSMISYILLILLTIIMGGVAYIFLKSYVPQASLDCPSEVGDVIKEASFNNSNSILTLSLVNSGKFDIGGYFIHATNNSSQETATIDLSPYLNQNGSKKVGNSVVFGLGLNSLTPGESRTDTFNISSSLGNIYSVTIIPIRYQVDNGRQRLVSCNKAEVKQIVGVSTGIPIVNICPDNVREGSEVCDGTDLNNQTCQSQGFTGGGPLSCLANCSGFNTIQCTNFVCGNGIIEAGETCDDGGNSSGNGCSSSCRVEFGWSCSGQPSQCSKTLMTLYYDDFENYTSPHGPSFVTQMANHGWFITDFLGSQPIDSDDVYLNDTLKYQGVYSVTVRDDSNITANMSTIGYNNITFNYSRRTFSLESGDKFLIYWRVGNAGAWNQLESISGDSNWLSQQWNLIGAENKSLVQVRFFLYTTQPGGAPPNGGNGDYGFADNVNITGKIL